MLTAPQLRAARGLLDWTRADLAKAANISPETIKNIEHGTFRPQEATTQTIIRAFAMHDVVFTEEEGVKRRRDTVTILNGDDCYLKTLEHAEMIMQGDVSEILFMYVDNALSSDAVIEVDLRLRKMGCKFRSLIEEGNSYILYPLTEYRCLPRRFFNNEVHVVYKDRVATLINKREQMVIIRNGNIADTMRKSFEFIWAHCSQPSLSTAKKRYD